MNKLSKNGHTFCNSCARGMAIRSIVRVTGVSKNTVAKLVVDAGAACQAYHDPRPQPQQPPRPVR